MTTPEHGDSFDRSGAAYDDFMGRYSAPLAELFADAADVTADQDALDVGCGPGALTSVLASRLGPGRVWAVDPSAPFAAACARRHPDVTVEVATADDLPYADASFDRVLAQLVLHFVPDPAAAGRAFARVLRPGGIAAACVWDFDDGMELLRHYWDAALAVDPTAPDEARTLRFGRAGELGDWLRAAGFEDVTESELVVSSTYAGVDELWASLLQGVGPAGAHCVGLPRTEQAAVRAELVDRLGSPPGSFTLGAVARTVVGRLPAG